MNDKGLQNNKMQNVPLTESQLGVYLECIENPESTKYNIAFALSLPPETDTARFAQAVKTVVERHPILFTYLSVSDDGPVMNIGNFSCDVVRKKIKNAEIEKKSFLSLLTLNMAPCSAMNCVRLQRGFCSLWMFTISCSMEHLSIHSSIK